MKSPLRLILVAIVITTALAFWFTPTKSQQNIKICACSEQTYPHATHPAQTQQSAINATLTEPASTSLLDFDNWLTAWQQSQTPAARSALLEQGRLFAKQRNRTMRALMRNAPDSALAQAISYSDYAALPDVIREWVEEPFSTSGSLDVQISCGQQHRSQKTYTFEDNAHQRWHLYMPQHHRVSQSKRGLPVQGIRIDSIAVVRGSVFQTLTGNDAVYVTKHWQTAQPAPQRCYATGQPIQGDGLTAVAGGRVFYFQNQAALQTVESALQGADSRAGLDVGSQWILRKVLSDGFPFEQFALEAEAAAFASTTGPKTAFFILVDFPDLLGAPIAAATLEQVIDIDVNNALNEYSYSLTSMDATVSAATYTVDSDRTEYFGPKDDYDIYDEALDAYIADGNDDPRSTYDTVGVYFNDIGFSWAGLASVGGQKMWLQGTTNPEVILHEFGHNYGLSHANYWVHDNSNGSSTDPADPTGANEEYGDPTDVMGDGTVDEGHFHVPGKQFLGWIDGNQWQDLSTSADNSSYRIYRFDDVDATGVQGLRIAKSATSDHYWLSYRKSHNNHIAYSHGAYLLWEQYTSENEDNNQSWLIDTTPGSADGKDDAPLRLGRTYTDSASDVYITVTNVSDSNSDEYIDVVVNFGPFAGNSPPAVTLSGLTSIAARQAVLFSADATDADGDTLVYAWDFGDGSVPSNAPSITHSWTVGGTYTVSLTVSDMKGGSTTVSQTVTVSDPLNSWTDHSSGVTEDLNAVAANGTVVIAVGDSPTNEVGSFARILRTLDGSTWTNHSPTGSVHNLHCKDVIWDGSEFLIAGYDYDDDISGWEGVIYSSPDGRTWTRAYETNAADTQLYSLSHDASGTICAAGESGTIVRRSSDGTWSTPTSGVSTNHVLRGIAYGEGTFVAVGHQTTPSNNGDVQIIRSTDGLTWTNASFGTTLDSWKDFRTIVYTDTQFIASGFYSGIHNSTNQGLTWTADLPTDDRYTIAGFSTGAGLIYAIGIDGDNSDANIDLFGTSSTNWAELSPSTSTPRNDITYFNNTFITVGDNGSIRQSAPLSDNNPPTATLIGPTNANARQAVLFSADASDMDGDTLAYTWNLGDGSVPSNAPTVTHSWTVGGTYTVYLTIIDMKGGSTSVSQTVTVNDPLNSWTDNSSGVTEKLNAVATNGTVVVAVGDSPTSEVGDFARILRTIDGSTWTNHSPSGSVLNLYCKDVIWDGSEFLIAGKDYDFGIEGWEGVIYSSPNGLTWTRAYETNTADTELYSITHDSSGTICAAGESGTIVRRSSEGTWSIPSSGVSTNHVLRGIAYGEGTFVAVGHKTTPSYNGEVQIIRSTDGLAWTDASTGTTLDSSKDFRTIEYTGAHFVASGFYSGIHTSTNQGLTWTADLPTDDRYTIAGFSTGAGLIYAIGIDGDNSDANIDLFGTSSTNWAELSPSTSTPRNDITYFNNTFITVGDNGSIRQSTLLADYTEFTDYISTYYSGEDSVSTANPDGDWANNLIEYALGSAPDNNGSSPTIPNLTINASNQAVFELSRTQQRPDIAYSVWWSTNLIDWTQAGLTVVTDNDTTVKVRSTEAIDAQDKAFFLLKLTQP